jgi:hypothetical protein
MIEMIDGIYEALTDFVARQELNAVLSRFGLNNVLPRLHQIEVTGWNERHARARAGAMSR